MSDDHAADAFALIGELVRRNVMLERLASDLGTRASYYEANATGRTLKVRERKGGPVVGLAACRPYARNDETRIGRPVARVSRRPNQ